MAKVFLNAGHGGSDPGAVAYGMKEKDINLTTMLACNEELVRHGVITIMSRTTDVDETSGEIISEANASGADLAVSFHANAGGGDGFEGYYYAGNADGKRLVLLCEKYVKEIGQNSRGAKTANLFFTRETNMTAVLLESFFVDHDIDNNIGDTVAEQKAFGVAYAKAILEYLGITYKAKTQATTPAASTKKLYRVQTGAYSVKENADKQFAKVKAAGFAAYMVKVNNLYKIQVGAYSVKENADKQLAKVKAAGFDAFITTEAGQAVSQTSTQTSTRTATIKEGSTVRLKAGAKTYEGGGLADYVYTRKHTVEELSGDRAVIAYAGVTVAAVRLSDLTLA